MPSGWHQRLLERTTTSCHRRSLQLEARQGSAAQPSIGCQTDSDRAATTLLRQRCRVRQHSRSQLGLHQNKHEGLLLRNYSAYCSYQSRLRSSFVRAHSFPLERGGKPFKAARSLGAQKCSLALLRRPLRHAKLPSLELTHGCKCSRIPRLLLGCSVFLDTGHAET